MDSNLFFQAPAQAAQLSHPVSPVKITLATVKKNLQVSFRYLPNLAGNFLNIAVRALFFLLMANTISLTNSSELGVPLAGRTLYIFFLGSLALFIFNQSTMWGPLNQVTNDLYNGTLEYLFSSPGSRYAYFVGVVISETLMNLVVFIPIFILLVVYTGIGIGDILMMMAACALIVTALTAMGVMIALLGLLWRQVNALVQVLGILFEMLAGAYLPVSAFPAVLRPFAYLLPYTWGYDLVRYYSFAGAWRTLLPVWQEWAILALFAVVFTLLSRSFLARAERQSKQVGLNVI